MTFRRMMQTFAVLLALSCAMVGQVAGRYDNFAAKSASGSLSSSLTVVAGAQIRVCTAAATGTPCTPLANVYTSSSLASGALISQPFSTDSRGNYWFYADASQSYVIQITDPSTGAVTELRDQALASGAGAAASTRVSAGQASTQNLLAALTANIADQFMAFLSDSTCHDYPDGTGLPTVPRWCWYLVKDHIAKSFPAYTVKYRNVTDGVGTLGPWYTIQTGTGSHTLWVTNWSWPGMAPANQLGPNLAGIIAGTPKFIIVAHGHNMGDSTASGNWKGDMMALTETVSQTTGADILIVAQNPEYTGCIYADCTTMPAKADVFGWVAAKGGYGFINVTQAFYDYGANWYSTLLSGDFTHESDAGAQYWASLVAPAFTPSRDNPVRSGHPSTLSTGGVAQLIKNGNFNNWSGACPDNWSVGGTTTCSVDTTSGHYRSPNGYGVKLSSSSGTGDITQALPIEEVKGRWVTVTASVYVPTGLSTNYAGWMAITSDVGSNAQATVFTTDTARGAGGLITKVISKYIDPTATTAAVNLYADQGATNGWATFDWVSVTLGQVPSMPGKVNSASFNPSSSTINLGQHAVAGDTNVYIDAPTANLSAIRLRKNGLDRALFYLNSTTESGSNAGSCLQMQLRDDAGSTIDSPFRVCRNAGAQFEFTRQVGLNVSAIATTPSDALFLQNLTLATVGVPVQYSPSLRLRGYALNTSGNTNWTADWRQTLVPISGNPPTFAMTWDAAANGGGFATKMQLDNTGNLSINGSFSGVLTNKFIVQGTADSNLTNAQFLGALSTCLLKNTTTTGVLSCAAAATDYVAPSTTVNGKALSSNVTLGLASADFANQGTTTTTLHGNAGGNPSFGATTVSDASGNVHGNSTKFQVSDNTGTSGNLAKYDANGNVTNGPTPPAGTIVGDSDTQTLSNKTFTGATNGNSVTLLNHQASTASGGFTGNAADQTVYTYTLPGNVLAAAKGVRVTLRTTKVSGANSAVERVKFGGTNMCSNTGGTANSTNIVVCEIWNVTTSSQEGYTLNAITGSTQNGIVAHTTAAINTTSSVAIIGTVAVTSPDTFNGDGWTVELIQ